MNSGSIWRSFQFEIFSSSEYSRRHHDKRKVKTSPVILYKNARADKAEPIGIPIVAVRTLLDAFSFWSSVDKIWCYLLRVLWAIDKLT